MTGISDRKKPYLDLINTVETKNIPRTIFMLCSNAHTGHESVSGISMCVRAWFGAVDRYVIVSAMIEAFVQRTASHETRLAIIYVVNDCVQHEPAAFGAPGYLFFQRTSSVTRNLPSEIKRSVIRVLDILAERGAYNAAELSSIKSSINQDPTEKHAILEQIVKRECLPRSADLELIDKYGDGLMYSFSKSVAYWIQNYPSLEEISLYTTRKLKAYDVKVLPDNTLDTSQCDDLAKSRLAQDLQLISKYLTCELELLQLFLASSCLEITNQCTRLLNSS